MFVVNLAGQHFPDWDRPTGRPRALSVVEAMRLTLCRLRRNATYQDLHEDFGVEDNRRAYHQQMVAFLAEVLGAADEASLSALVAGRVCLIDGTLVPTVHRRHRTDLRSGKHRRYGVNVQLLVDLHGRLLAASRAFPGSWHDVRCFREAGWVELVKSPGAGSGIWATRVNPRSCTHRSRSGRTLTCVTSHVTSTAASPASGLVPNGASGI